MSLSCECDYDADYYWEDPVEVKRYRTTKSCDGCGVELVNKSGWMSWASWDDDGEPRFYPAKSDKHMRLCEPCGDFYVSLKELGFCRITPATMRYDWECYQSDFNAWKEAAGL